MSTTSAKTAVADETEHVEQHIRDVVERLQSSIRTLIEALPGVTRRPADLRRTLGVNPKLAWQVHRFAYANDACTEVPHLPRSMAMDRVLLAAMKRSVPERLIDAVRTVFSDYEDLARHHAGGRAGFESLLSNFSDAGSSRVEINHRRAAFNAQGHILGVQADAHLACYIIQPSEDDASVLDAIGVRGLIGFQRLRRNVAWIISRMRATDEDGTLRQYAGPTPLADERDDDEARFGLIQQFCSKPLPKLSLRPDGGWADVELQPSGIGAQSAVTCMVGHVFRSAFSRYPDEKNKHHESHTLVRTPCKVLVQDTLMHRDLVPKTPPHVAILSDHRDIDPTPHGRVNDVLTSRASVVHLGRGPAVVGRPEIPHYEDLVRYSLDRLGWRPDDFEVFRCLIEYPVMPSSVVTRFDLTEQGAT